MKNLKTFDEFLNESFQIGDNVHAVGTAPFKKWKFYGEIVKTDEIPFKLVLKDTNQNDFLYFNSSESDEFLKGKQTTCYKKGFGKIEIKIIK